MAKIMFVVGNRPHFVKLSVLWPLVSDVFDCVLVHTGQHYSYNMSGTFFDELRLPVPNYNLQMVAATRAQQVGKMLTQLDPIISIEKPDLLCVIGDTSSSLAAALAGAMTLKLPIVHIEAGSRSNNTSEIEEINRRIIDSVSTYYLCPTKEAAKNLLDENRRQDQVFVVGDLLFDAIDAYLPDALAHSSILQTLGVRPEQFILFTLHKPTNTLDPQRISVLSQLIDEFKIPFVWPIHPGTKASLERQHLLHQIKCHDNLLMIEPVSYRDMLMLEKNCRLILTDSSGVQREGNYLRKPTLILSEKTEHSHILREGFCELLPLDDGSIEKVRVFIKKLQPNEHGVSVELESRVAHRILQVLKTILL